MRTTGFALAAAVLFTAVGSPAVADETEEDLIPGTFSGSAALASDYRFRGVSQTDKNPAIQAALEYAINTTVFDTEAYAGFWGSNVDFNDDDEATVEIDALFGLRGPIADTGLSWDLGGIYYAYPGANKQNGKHLNYDYWEIAAKLGYQPIELVSFDLGNYYSPDFFGATGTGNYFIAGVTVTPPIDLHKDLGLALFGTIGRQHIEDATDYTDWSAGVRGSYKFIDLSVAYVDTNLTQADLGGSKLANAGVVAILTASF